MEGKALSFYVLNPLWLKCSSLSSLELIKDKAAWETQTTGRDLRTVTATRCNGGQRQE